MGILTFQNTDFLMDGKKYVIASGAMHYFRIPRAYWRDRLRKLRQCGFNTLETYACWNLHEPKEGQFDFSGMLDIAAYIQMAAEEGLNVILRPGPYICAEWDFGGLPAWLLSKHDMSLRCNDPAYLACVRRYYHALFDQLRPSFTTNGGNLMMVQIENEYGSYGDDKEYLRAVRDILLECGVDVLLFTADGTESWMLSGGTLPEHLCVANFGSEPQENFLRLKEFRPDQPLMCGEFWCGWFDHWYEEHHGAERPELPALYRGMLEAGASVNFYMFHGGTNFGFWNGANHIGFYQPTITSYDYHALLTEAGDLTDDYYAIRKENKAFFGKIPELTVQNTPKANYDSVMLTEKAFLLEQVDRLAKPVHAAAPAFQEDLGQNFGYTLYSSEICGPIGRLPLEFDCLHDRAVIFVNGQKIGWCERGQHPCDVSLELSGGEKAQLSILVENMGRVNYGPFLRDQKGMTGMRLGQRYHFGWDMYPLEMKDLSTLQFEPLTDSYDACSFLRGWLTISEEPKDTFISLPGFHHGFVTVNGFCLGRYYNDAGPQKTLFCPAPMLRQGKNEIIVFETDGTVAREIQFVDHPELG